METLRGKWVEKLQTDFTKKRSQHYGGSSTAVCALGKPRCCFERARWRSTVTPHQCDQGTTRMSVDQLRGVK